jgi:hypothetical protein
MCTRALAGLCCVVGYVMCVCDCNARTHAVKAEDVRNHIRTLHALKKYKKYNKVAACFEKI